MKTKSEYKSTSTHWGTYTAETKNGKLVKMHPYKLDEDPSEISDGLPSAINDELRIRKPHVRKGWLNKNKSILRGSDSYITVSWEDIIEILAKELSRIKEKYGNKSFFAGSYGWASAGRFHHAQGQLHRFFNCFGGYTKSVGTYSYAASEAIIPHIIGMSYYEFLDKHTDWDSIKDHSTLVLSFGGLPIKNSQVTSGGVGKHTTRKFLMQCRENGVKFVNINPMKVDSDLITNSQHIKIRPCTDTALMIAISFVLEKEKLCDLKFLDTYCVGYKNFRDYLLGKDDKIPKSPEWAEKITGISSDIIWKLARQLPKNRVMITGAWAIQRQEFGEQPHWMIVVLACMLGQIGLPGGGFGLGYSSENGIGNPVKLHKWPAFPQFKNPISSLIPVARTSDMLLNPGKKFDFNGKEYSYPEIKLVYWAGGNPFHHQMELGKLQKAFQRPECVVTNEIWWNSLARHSDIVLPTTSFLERNDIAMGHWDRTITPMHKVIDPVGESKTDYEIFSLLSKKLNFYDLYTENKEEKDWLNWLWKEAETRADNANFKLPKFNDFWKNGSLEFLEPEKNQILLENFRTDPIKYPLETPSGKIEIFSETISRFKYNDCIGHPKWFVPKEWLGSPLAQKYPLHLISGQPPNKLHSQLDNGSFSKKSKIRGREVVSMNPKDAAERGLEKGDIAEIFNDRGKCLSAVNLCDEIMESTIFLPTGAWFDPLNQDFPFCQHGNPNVLTKDYGTSKLGQGPTAHSTLVQIRKYKGTIRPIQIFKPPLIK